MKVKMVKADEVYMPYVLMHFFKRYLDAENNEKFLT